MIKITGHKLRESLKIRQLELATILTNFDDSLFTFVGEKKETPMSIMEKVMKLEGQIAELQVIQAFYNLNVKITLKKDGKEKMVPLDHAIKIIGGIGRAAKRWRDAAKGEKRDRYYHRSLERDKDKEQAEPTISKEEALKEAIKIEKYASLVRIMIAKGNLTEIEIEDSFAELFTE